MYLFFGNILSDRHDCKSEFIFPKFQ